MVTEINVSDLRYRCLLATRTLVPSPNGAPVPSLITQRMVYCNILPVSEYILLNSLSVDNEITHEIYMRYQDQIELCDVLLRPKAINPDQSTVYEQYHIAGAIRIDGRRRFLKLRARLEKATVTY
jgi:head-tail adaptor